MLIDSHCHLDKLDLTPYGGDIRAALDSARERGVAQMLCIGICMERIQEVVDLAERFPWVYASAGVHPLYRDNADPDVDALVQWSHHPKVVAIGETGLDYFYGDGDLTWQRDRFVTHIEAAKAARLPLIIHTRGAKEDTLKLLRDVGEHKVTGVLHCFTEDLDMAKQAIELGFYISISGIVTFNNASALRDVLAALPLDRILVETDSPWLAPVPYRGKKNEPKYVVEVAEKVAEISGQTFAEVAQTTTDNFFTLFKKANRH